MLGKLLFHEWKDSWKLMVILNGAVVALSLAGIALNIFTGSIDLLSAFESGGMLIVIIYGSYMMIYVLSIFALTVGSALYFYVRFYRNLYTDQGYLMHTLPVSEHLLICSKAVIAIIWSLIGTVVMAVGIGSLMISFIGPMFYDEFPSIRDIYEQIDLADINPFYLFVYAFLALTLGIGLVVFSVFKGYAAISIGQLASKNKVLASVGAFFGIQIVLSIVRNIITHSFMFIAIRIDFRWDYLLDDNPMVFIYLIVANMVVYGLSVGFYFITQLIMKNRLNLE